MTALDRLFRTAIILACTACTTSVATPTSTPIAAATPVQNYNIETVGLSPTPSQLPAAGEVQGSISTMIPLASPPQTKKLVYEIERVEFQFSYEDYLQHLAEYIAQQPQLPDRLESHLAELEAYFSEQDIWRLSAPLSCTETEAGIELCWRTSLPSGDGFLVEMLEAGDVAVYDKLTQSYVPEIERRDYSIECGIGCGNGHRAFYLSDGTLLLNIMLWIE